MTFSVDFWGGDGADKPIKCGKYVQYFKNVMLCDYDYNTPVMIEIEIDA